MECVPASASARGVPVKRLSKLGHLARRFLGSVSHRSPRADQVAWALSQLLPGETTLWQKMSVQDRRHSIVVARRFQERAADAARAEVAGALLHDVGKTASSLGTVSRVVATLIGPRTKRFRSYHDHEALGIEMLRAAGSDAETLALIEGNGRNASALRAADAI